MEDKIGQELDRELAKGAWWGAVFGVYSAMEQRPAAMVGSSLALGAVAATLSSEESWVSNGLIGFSALPAFYLVTFLAEKILWQQYLSK
jgi:hypothetical protein